MLLTVFLATTASACRRLLADAVSAVEAEASPRLLQERDMHFSPGDWGSNGVLLLEADGSPCASGTGGDAVAAGAGGYSVSFEAPEKGCYRVDAHAAGADCGFGSEVTLTIDWCRGRTDTVKYSQAAGWTPIGTYSFHSGKLSGIAQLEGAVDAFRVVPVPGERGCRQKDAPVFGSLTVDTDATGIPADLASTLAQQVTDMGDVLSASFRPYVDQGRRLSASGLNHVVIDFDTSKMAAPKAMPTEEQLNNAATAVCNSLQTTACATTVTFKYDESGEVKHIEGKGRGGTMFKMFRGGKGIAACVALFSAFTVVSLCVFRARKWFKKPDASDTLAAVAKSHGLEDRAAVGAAKAEEGKLADEDEWNTVGAAFWDAEEEKKPRSAAADDDDASTATPADLASLPDSLDGRRATLDNDAADRV